MSGPGPGAQNPNPGQPEQVFCPNCHGGNPPNAANCQWCGQPLAGATIAMPQQPSPWEAPTQAQQVTQAYPPPAGSSAAQPTMPYQQQPQQGIYGQQYGQQQYGQQAGPPPAYPPQYSYAAATPPPVTNVQTQKRGAPVWLIVLGVLLLVCVVGTVGVVYAITRTTAAVVNSGTGAIATVQAGISEAMATLTVEAGSGALEAFPTDTPEAGIQQPTDATPEAAPTDTADTGAAAPTDTVEAAPADTPVPAAGPAQSVGGTADTGSMKVTLNGVRYDKSGLLPPSNGNEYAILDLTFENTSSQESVVSSLLCFTLTDSDGKKYDVALGADVKNHVDGSVPAGGKLTGETAFEVPTTAKGLVFRFDPILNGSPVEFKLDR